MTILFVDIVNFTPLSERLSPREVSAVKGSFHIQKVGKKTVKGKGRAVTVYEVLDDGEGGDGAC